jgi:hypothetical protein
VSDFTAKEQDNGRAALRFLRARCGTWDAQEELHVGRKRADT